MTDTYRKIGPDNPVYRRVEKAKAAGQWVCDSDDHNEWYGCSNPECFNHPGQKERIRPATKLSPDLAKIVDELFR